MTILVMLNKDIIFRKIVKEVRYEFSSFENLDIVPREMYDNIIIPIMDNVCNKYLDGIDVYYSYFLERVVHDKKKNKIEMGIALFIKEACTPDPFKRYAISLSFDGII